MRTPSTAADIHDAGFRDGLEYGQLEGHCRQLSKLLTRFARKRFGQPPTGTAILFDLLDSRQALDCLQDLAPRLLTATGWSDWTAGVTPPEHAPPPLPRHTADCSFEPGPATAGFDQVMVAPLLPGAEPMPPSGRPGKAGPYDRRRVIIHMRFQKWHEPDLDKLMYKTSRRLRETHRIDHVESVLFLLFEMADGPGVTGKWVVPSLRGKKFAERFEYQIVRVFEKPPEFFYPGGPVAAMMAPLSAITEDRLPEVIGKLQEGVANRKTAEKDAINFWGAVHWWMGLRYSAEVVNRALAPVMSLVRREDSYLSLLAEGHVNGRAAGEKEGRLQATRWLILRLGTVQLGEPATADRETIEGCADLAVLESWAARALETATWAALLEQRPTTTA